MEASVGDRWGEYLRHGRGMSDHTIEAYLGDLRSLLSFAGLAWEASAAELAEALTQRRIRS